MQQPGEIDVVGTGLCRGQRGQAQPRAGAVGKVLSCGVSASCTRGRRAVLPPVPTSSVAVAVGAPGGAVPGLVLLRQEQAALAVISRWGAAGEQPVLTFLCLSWRCR